MILKINIIYYYYLTNKVFIVKFYLDSRHY